MYFIWLWEKCRFQIPSCERVVILVKWSYHDCVRHISKDQDRITKPTSNWFWLVMNNCKKKNLRASQWLMTITWVISRVFPKWHSYLQSSKSQISPGKYWSRDNSSTRERSPEAPMDSNRRKVQKYVTTRSDAAGMAYEVSSAMRFPQCRWRTFWYFLQCVKISAKPYNF